MNDTNNQEAIDRLYKKLEESYYTFSFLPNKINEAELLKAIAEYRQQVELKEKRLSN